MALTDEEKARVRYHLGYPSVSTAASIQYGMPALTQTNFLVENVLGKLLESILPRVRGILVTLDGIEDKLVAAQDRLAATKLEELTLREDETDKLEGEYRRWGHRLADICGCPIYPFAMRYKGGANSVQFIPRG